MTSRSDPPPRGPRRTSGFSLLEVILAMALIALFVFPLLVVRNRAIESTADAQWQRRAAELARAKLATLSLEGSGSTSDTSGTFDTEDGAEFTWELQMNPSEGGSTGGDLVESLLGTGASGSVGAGGQDGGKNNQPAFWEVQLTVFYPSMRLGTRELVVSTLLPNPLAAKDTSGEESAGGNGLGS